MRETYCHATLVTQEGVGRDICFEVDQGVFVDIAIGGTEGADLGGAYVLPGFIDSHIHGFGPYDFEDPGCDFAGAAGALKRFGVTAFLPTVCPKENASYPLVNQEAILGFHLEGPFINPERMGGFSREQILPYRLPLAEEILAAFHGQARIMTAAPEMVALPEFAALAQSFHVRLSAGHTQADLNTARSAFAGGFRAVTHFFNAMPGHHHRSPGIWDEAMLNDQVTLEVIADLHHVSAESLALLIKCKGASKLIAVTDSVCARGPGFEIKDGLAYKNGVICGSQSTMHDLFVNLVRRLNVPLPLAVSMTSANIAKALGLMLGDIRKGYRADFLVMDEELHVKAVHTNMKMEYCAQSACI